jgi:hypothetical protein
MTKNIKITENTLKQLNACQEGIDFFNRNNLEGFKFNEIDKIKGDFEGIISWFDDFTIAQTDENNNILKYETKIRDLSLPIHTEVSLELDDIGNVLKRLSVLKNTETNKILETKDTTYTYKNNILIYKETKLKPNEFTNQKIFTKYNDLGLIKELISAVGEHNKYYYDKNNRLISCVSNNSTIEHSYDHDTITTEYYHCGDLVTIKEVQYDEVGNKLTEWYDFMRNNKTRFNYYKVDYYDNGQLKSINDLTIPYIKV